ncbi:MAG: hypothetical protein D3923_19965, partial [Candidatus Electrothrix sp. AR3]|nr:hypothetical protein [Candidatus Electrothrix sp. AR3]
IGLKKRIYSGYIVTGTVTLMIALLSWVAFNRLSTDFQTIVSFSEQSIDNMAFTLQMSEMQRQALIYIYNGHDAAGDQVGEVHAEMLEKVSKSLGGDQAEIDAIAKNTQEHLQTYYDTFLEVRKQRDLQQQLVRREFRIYASKAQKLIEEMMERKDLANTLEYSRMLNALLQIEKNAYRYFDSLDSALIKAASSSIERTRSMVTLLLDQFPNDSQQLGAIKNVLDRYESSFLEAVQRTRGYLYLINVVMAAQAYETIYQSGKLSALMLSESKRIQKKIWARIGSTLKLLLFSTAFLLVFLIFFSYLISQSITLPLKRLTRTFKALALGSSNTNIPIYTLQD